MKPVIFSASTKVYVMPCNSKHILDKVMGHDIFDNVISRKSDND
ncbi:hypothetical protein N7U66_06310 [Lacinutrix neustonica]|uniref:Uncharacterized protein n=1 Tax=Lacinutrix neustonica TaxID=2980107 RepID=A0A9E8SEW8_9FLAO|nr:hypothetical protein [Lacinutrix neustonica]WAC03197.1 hypothetical protein N7U66_06310 [Lacinutrix neustonica]